MELKWLYYYNDTSVTLMTIQKYCVSFSLEVIVIWQQDENCCYCCSMGVSWLVSHWIKFLLLKIDLDKSAIRVTVNVIRVTGGITLKEFFIKFIKELKHKHLWIQKLWVAPVRKHMGSHMVWFFVFYHHSCCNGQLWNFHSYIGIYDQLLVSFSLWIYTDVVGNK